MLPIDLNQLRWIVPTALACVLLIQILYLGILSRVPKPREVNQPPLVLPPVQAYMPVQEVRVQPAAVAMPSAAPSPSTAAPAPVMPDPQPLASMRPPAATAAPSAPVAAPVARSGGIGKLIVLAGVEGVSEIALPAKEFSIGRFYSPENDILVGLDEKSVSRKHCRFLSDEAIREYYLKDTSSSFGTFLLINGQFEQLAANVQERLYNEDVVRFGNIVTVRLLLPCETRGAVTSL